MSTRHFYSSIGSTQIRVSVSSCRMEASAAAAADQSRLICRRTHTRSFLFPMESAGRLRWLSRTVRTCRVSTVKKSSHFARKRWGRSRAGADRYGKRKTIGSVTSWSGKSPKAQLEGGRSSSSCA